MDTSNCFKFPSDKSLWEKKQSCIDEYSWWIHNLTWKCCSHSNWLFNVGFMKLISPPLSYSTPKKTDTLDSINVHLSNTVRNVHFNPTLKSWWWSFFFVGRSTGEIQLGNVWIYFEKWKKPTISKFIYFKRKKNLLFLKKKPLRIMIRLDNRQRLSEHLSKMSTGKWYKSVGGDFKKRQ